MVCCSRTCSVQPSIVSMVSMRIASEGIGPLYHSGSEARQYLHALVDQLRVAVASPHEVGDVREHLLGVGAAGADAADADDGGVPDLVIVHLGGGDVEAVAHTLHDGLDHAPLIFQRVAIGDGDGEAADSDD